MKPFGFIQDIQGLRKMCHLPRLSKLLLKNDCQKKKKVKNESKRREGIKLRNNNLAIHTMIESK